MLFFLFLGRKRFSTSIFDKGIVSRRCWRLNTWFIANFESLFNGPDKFMLSVRFSFSIQGDRSVL